MTRVITIGDQRFYPLPEGGYLPSVTTILGACYPTSRFLVSWQIEKGKDEGERILKEAADDGTFVHEKVEQLIKGLKVNTENLNPKQAKCLLAFKAWADEVKPEFLATEQQVYCNELGFAGTIDILCRLDGELYIVDLKTSKGIYDSHLAQVAAYAHAYGKPVKAAILHVNSTTKKSWSFKEVDLEPNWIMFDLCRRMFQHLYPNAEPKILEMPDYISLNQPKHEDQTNQ